MEHMSLQIRNTENKALERGPKLEILTLELDLKGMTLMLRMEFLHFSPLLVDKDTYSGILLIPNFSKIGSHLQIKLGNCTKETNPLGKNVLSALMESLPVKGLMEENGLVENGPRLVESVLV